MITRAMTAATNPFRTRFRSRIISRLGTAPDSVKTMQAATTMAAKFVMKRRSAPAASSGRPSSRQIPTVASGGTSATAMATPGRASEPVRRTATNAPAAPAARATPRSSRPGAVRASSDGVSSRMSGRTRETRKPMATTQSDPRSTCSPVIHCQWLRAVTSAPAKAMIAPPRGATTMAPMIEATESW